MVHRRMQRTRIFATGLSARSANSTLHASAHYGAPPPNRFEREKRQFDAGLPVYAAKEEVGRGAIPAMERESTTSSLSLHGAAIDYQLIVLIASSLC